MIDLKNKDGYKDSGIEWIGYIPEEWKVSRIKNVIDNTIGGDWGKELSEKVDNSYKECNVIRIPDFNRSKKNINDKNFTRRFIKKSSILSRKLEYGDLLLEKSGGGEKVPVGNVVVFDKNMEAISSNFISKLKINKNSSPFFINYYFGFLYSIKRNILSIKETTGIQNLNQTDYFSNFIFLPPKQEQKRIANYLDQKTELADKKIEVAQKRKKLLLEFKKSLINQVVTKGLRFDLDFENNAGLSEKEFDLYMKDNGYKDSGIEWIGWIPEGWSVNKLKDMFIFSKGKNAGKYSVEYISNNIKKDGFPVYSGQTKNNGILGTIDSYEYNISSVIFVTTVGAKAMENKLINGKFSLSQNCALMELKLENNVYSYHNYILQLIFKEERKRIATIITPSLRIEDLRVYNTLYPPKEEQQQIANYLDQKTAQIDKEVAQIDKETELIKEFKKTLINDVVTGKIRV